jgi:hypothetical protein
VHFGITLPVQAGMPRVEVYTAKDVYSKLRANTSQYLIDNVCLRGSYADARLALPPLLKLHELDLLRRGIGSGARNSDNVADWAYAILSCASSTPAVEDVKVMLRSYIKTEFTEINWTWKRPSYAESMTPEVTMNFE